MRKHGSINFLICYHCYHEFRALKHVCVTKHIVNPLIPGRLLTVLSIFPRSAFDGFYLQMSLSHGYLLQIRINQVREVSIVYCQWIVIAPTAYLSIESSSVKAVFSLVCEIFVISFKNGVLLGWLERRNCPQKNYLPYLIHFGVILQRTYVATFLSLHDI